MLDNWAATDKAWLAGVLDGRGYISGKLNLDRCPQVRRLVLDLFGLSYRTRVIRPSFESLAATTPYRSAEAPPGGPRASAAWLAAVVDVHGSVLVERRPENVYVGVLTVASTREVLVRRVALLVGVGAVVREDRGERPPRFRWRVAARQAREVVERIGPYIIEKKAHVVLLLRRPTDATAYVAMRGLNLK